MQRLLRLRAHLARFGVTFDTKAISFPEAVRAVLAVGPFLIASNIFDVPALRISAVAAFLTCLSESGGPVNQRVRPTLGFTIAGATLAASLGMIRSLGQAPGIIAGTATLFCLAMLRSYGQSTLVVGVLLSVMTILSLDYPLTPGLAAYEFGAFMAGGLWAAALALVIWRLHPHLPARRALAGAYRALGRMVSDMHGMSSHHVNDPAQWEALARTDRRPARDSLETARAAVLGAIRWIGPSSPRAVQGLIRLEVAEQCFVRLIALSDLLEQGASRDDEDAASRVLRRLRPLLRILAHSILHDDHKLDQQMEATTRAMAHDTERLEAQAPIRLILNAIIERIHIAVTLSTPANYVPGAGLNDPRPPLPQRMFGPFVNNLNIQSLIFRHSLRVALVAAPALAVSMVLGDRFEHWLTITFVVTIQPFYAQTVTRAIERIGGTVLGGVIAAGLGLVITPGWTEILGILLFLLIAFSVRYVSLGVFLITLTPMVVLLTQSAYPDTNEWVVAAYRAAHTTLGGIIALLASYILWPSWVPTRIGSEIEAALRAHCAYALAIFDRHLGKDIDTTPMRRAAGLASNNIEASLSRILVEPQSLDKKRIESWMVVDAALRRMAGRLAVLHETQDLRGRTEILTAWREWISKATDAVIQHNPLAPRPRIDPSIPGANSLLRISRQFELISDAF